MVVCVWLPLFNVIFPGGIRLFPCLFFISGHFMEMGDRLNYKAFALQIKVAVSVTHLTTHGMRLTKLRDIHVSTEKKLNKNEQTNKSPRGIVRLTVEWFLSQDNNQWPGWKWILLKTDTLSMEDKTAAGAFGHARNYGPAPLRKKVTDVIIVHMIVMLKRVMEKILNGIQRYRKSCMWTVYPLYCR